MKTTIHDILGEFREDAIHKRDMGDKFERLIANYLVTDPQYAQRFGRNVWLWSEWPERNNNPDTGVDIVAKDQETGEYWAIQCKFYAPDHTLEKKDIDSFFTASGKKPFSFRLIVSTTNRWGKNAEEALLDQTPPVSRLNVEDLDQSPVDWSLFSHRQPHALQLKEKKKLRPHQEEAQHDVFEGFKTHNRGKLIMACGTGKTFTALKIAEDSVPKNGTVLFLVPSISLLSQTLREWTAEAIRPLHSYTVCSDNMVARKKDENEDISVVDLAFPVNTNPKRLADLFSFHKPNGKNWLNVVFSTYQSIQVVSDAQKRGFPEFDLVICDEAHRTTGIEQEGKEASAFVRVHDEKFLKAKNRLYMTATPRLYADREKAKAKELSIEVYSMDDETKYGPEFHRLDFSKAVGKNLLSDYKVLVLAVDEKYVSKIFQRQLADKDGLKLEDAVKITGCWNGLRKKFAAGDEALNPRDVSPMRRAVVFCQSIKASKTITAMFNTLTQQFKNDDDDYLECQSDHVDGGMNSLERNQKLTWLKADTDENVCRILSNARCLSEGVDVPALDAVMFMNPRNSVVDVVQSVGRVMRKSPGKDYGYIILPIGIPAGVPPEEALNDNQKYRVVWQVLQALRAHDDRFNATINKIDLNQRKPDQIQVIGVGGGGKEDDGSKPKEVQFEFHFPEVEQLRNAIFAKIVKKCGDREYWEMWAKDVAEIAQRHISRIKALLEDSDPIFRKRFDSFLNGLRESLNPTIAEDDAIEMLAQHLITKPVFDALFEGYEFTKKNPVSKAMQRMVILLEQQSIEKESESLNSFYASVKERAGGIDNITGKQRLIIELYDIFFKTAFPKMAARLGIVYTPVEIVDFLIQSVHYALGKEFNTGLSGKNVHILDPFTGTGTFIVRLLQSKIIKNSDLERKYREELHANEIVLLAYYIAAINIEEAFHRRTNIPYEPFEGILLTDTFQMTETDESLGDIFPENTERTKRQRNKEIRVIIANPPYSVGQTSENDGNKNLKYLKLDESIRSSYVAHSKSINNGSLYDSYIRAIRWATDRIKKNGIVCYVTNGAFIDNNAMAGFRKCVADEFTAIYCFNLRGNQRTSGETSRMEGGKIFGSGSRTPIAVTMFVKNPASTGPCKIYYHDIGDYLTREEKLQKIKDFGSVENIPWVNIQPNEEHDWINQRNKIFEQFIPLGDKESKGDPNTESFFVMYSSGVKTNRDVWTYNFSKEILAENMGSMIKFYNSQVEDYRKASKSKKLEVEEFVDNDPKKVSWTRELKEDVGKFKSAELDLKKIRLSLYRPFTRQNLYFCRQFNNCAYKQPLLFPTGTTKNLVICLTGNGSQKEFSAIITNVTPDLELVSKSQCFPLKYLAESDDQRENVDQATMNFSKKSDGSLQNNISKKALSKYQTIYKDKKISEEDIFYYVYGIFHSPDYKTRFANDLRKTMPRIPFVEDFWQFSKSGRQLAELHLDYEEVKPWKVKEHRDDLGLDEDKLYTVQKMYFGKKDRKEDKSVIIYNSHITISDIPLEAYEYVVNGKPAIEWIMERYQVRVDKDSGIKNDPNDWGKENGNPRYILDLLKSVITVSVESVKIVKNLPPLKIIDVALS